jgi:hypothetical protein
MRSPPAAKPAPRISKPGEVFPVYYQKYVEVSAHLEGLFSFWVSESSQTALKVDMGISLEDIAPLAGKVFEKCREL